MTDEGRPSTGQDMLKGRRTEIDFINGLVAEKGEEVGIPAPTHAALTRMVKRVERGEIEAHPRNVEALSSTEEAISPSGPWEARG
jgi:2-dehydropantoate 2-reductase